MISEYDKHNIGKILRGHGDWFNAQLIRLVAKADLENREKLRLGFPDVVHVFELWDCGALDQVTGEVTPDPNDVTDEGDVRFTEGNDVRDVSDESDIREIDED